MLNEINFSNGWVIFIVIIVIIIIIWVIVANNRTPDTHIHAKPLFDAKSNTLMIRRAIYASQFKVVEQIFPEGPVSSKRPDPVFVTHASIPNNKATGTITVKLPPGANPLNTTVRVTNSIGKEDVINPVILESYTTCVDKCRGEGGGTQFCFIFCTQ